MKLSLIIRKIKNNGKLKSFFSVFSFGKDPYRDWKMLLFLFTLLFVLVLAFSIYFFVRIAHGDLFRVPVSQEVQPKIFDRVFMKEVLTEFDNKQKILAELKKNRIDIIDPAN